MHLLSFNLVVCRASHFAFNQSQSNAANWGRSCLRLSLEVWGSERFRRAAIIEEKVLLTNVTAISTRWRAFPADFFEISIWLLVAGIRRVAIPPNDAIVAESSIIHTHFGTTAGNKGEAKGGNDERGENGPGVGESFQAAWLLHKAQVYLQKAILNLCKFLSRASHYTT